MKKLRSNLFLLPNTCSIHFINPKEYFLEVKRTQTSKSGIPDMFKIPLITNLTFSNYGFVDLNNLMEYLRRSQDLHVEYSYDYSCIWECVHENRCQSAVYFRDDNICSIFDESCKSDSIQSSGNVSASVICYRKNQNSSVTCSSTDTTSQPTVTSFLRPTVNVSCGSTCVNASVSNISRLAFYSFDNVTVDAMGNYSASGIPSPIFVSGWIGSAISFSYANSQFLSTSHIPFNLHSFTIEFWFYATNLSDRWDFAFAGQHESSAQSKCLFLNIRKSVLFFGFFMDDTSGSTNITIKRWYHAAFVYNRITQRQYIYLDGVLESNAFAPPLQTTTGSFTIGGAKIGGSTDQLVYYSGYIDHFTISLREKSACEIYLDATLACYFNFDSIPSLIDSGPNFLTATATNLGTTSVPGRVNQAVRFSSTSSYITVNGISAMTASSTAFTISMWMNPTTVSGGATLIHASTQSDGQGICLAMWGLTMNGTMTVNVVESSNNTISASASFPLPLNTWTHVAQTFNSATGNYLYINGVLVASVNASTGQPIGPYAFLGASPANTSQCKAGSIIMGQFYGDIDEYYVFGRELTAADICHLANQ
ncbi:hypothetical protein I4U23_023010 [Adineta vaga]|nr:hypothetical protein I4U23_023010 [Adineta vaga]